MQVPWGGISLEAKHKWRTLRKVSTLQKKVSEHARNQRTMRERTGGSHELALSHRGFT